MHDETVLPMSAETTAEPGISPATSTLRVRRWRQRRRGKLRQVTVTVPQSVIDHAIARGLLQPAAEPWAVVQACYAAQLSDAVLNRLVDDGVITAEQVAILRGISAWLEPAESA
jgi:hypothetical protein